MNEVAARIMEHLCEHDAHGYTQGSRWGNGTTESINVDGQDYYFPGGDRDCSSAVISAYQAAGLDVDATYTGNMRSAFLATGLFEWHGMDFIAQRGDIYLNEGNHTAECTCPDPDLLAEFCIAENGGIYGVEGDQTGFEAYVHGYYDYPWDGILHFIGGEANNDWYIEPNPDVPIPEIPFRVKTENGWLAEDVPGDGTKIKAIAIDMPGWYQVCVMKPDGSKVWVETVSGYNITEPVIIDTERVFEDESARANNISVEERTDAVKGFCETIEAAGYTPMIYASRDQFVRYLNVDIIGNWEFWYCSYDNTSFPYHTEGYQYSRKGYVDGISTEVDMDVWMR